jgi:uncharacterized membrane protein YobD (UPF0266 family)
MLEMSSLVGRTSGRIYKIAISLAGLAILVYILIDFRVWSMDWTEYLLKRGRWEEIIFVSIVVFLISTIVIKLFQWHLRMQAGGR